jgi:hypothetical protein
MQEENMLTRLFLALTFVLVVAPLVAARSDLKLQFEIYKNGTLIGTPMLTVQEGGRGSLSLPNVVEVSVTPSRIAQDRVAIAFELTATGRTIRPRIVLLKEEQGVLTWKPASDLLELRVAASSK